MTRISAISAISGRSSSSSTRSIFSLIVCRNDNQQFFLFLLYHRIFLILSRKAAAPTAVPRSRNLQDTLTPPARTPCAGPDSDQEAHSFLYRRGVKRAQNPSSPSVICSLLHSGSNDRTAKRLRLLYPQCFSLISGRMHIDIRLPVVRIGICNRSKRQEILALIRTTQCVL